MGSECASELCALIFKHLGEVDMFVNCTHGRDSCVKLERRAVSTYTYDYVIEKYGPNADAALEALINELKALDAAYMEWQEKNERFERGEATLLDVLAARSRYARMLRSFKRHLLRYTRLFRWATGQTEET